MDKAKLRERLLAAPGALLTARAVATKFGLNRATIYNLAARGELPVVYVGGSVRFSVDDVSEFLAREKGQGAR